MFFELLREGAPPALAGAPLDRTSQAVPVFVGSTTVRSKWLDLDGGAQVLVSVRVVEELDSADTFLYPEAAQEAAREAEEAGATKRLLEAQQAARLDVMTVVEFEPVWNSHDAGTQRTVRSEDAPALDSIACCAVRLRIACLGSFRKGRMTRVCCDLGNFVSPTCRCRPLCGGPSCPRAASTSATAWSPD